MADYFVKHTGSDLDGLSWSTAKITLAGAMALAVAGDRIFVSNTHTETASVARTATSAGTPALPVQIYSVDDTINPVAAVTQGANVSGTGSGHYTVQGSVVAHGLNFTIGSSTTSANINQGTSTTVDVIQSWNNVNLYLTGTGSSSEIVIGGGSGNSARSRFSWNNVNVRLNASGQRITLNQELTWRGGTLSCTGVAASHIFRVGQGGRGAPVLVEGVDMSGIGVATDLVSGPNATGRVLFRNCTLPTGWTGQLVQGLIDPGLRVEMHNCDAAGGVNYPDLTSYRLWVAAFSGAMRSETAVTKVGGANDGVAPFSWKMETNGNPNTGVLGLESCEISRWNTTVGTQITVGIDLLVEGSLLSPAEAWLDVQYLGTPGSPKSTFVSSRPAPFASFTAPNNTPAPSTWNNPGSRVAQRLSVTFTPQEPGAIQCKVVLTRPNAVAYLDPKLVVS